MVISIQQAIRIQYARVAAGKTGYAKAVRRFLLSNHRSEYRKMIDKLPYIVPKPKQENEKKEAA